MSDLFSVSKTFSLDYSHRLHLLDPEHKCSNLHGHTGQVTFTLNSDFLNEFGMVKDFNDFCFMKKWIDTHLDHSMIVARSDVVLLKIAQENKMKYYVLDGIQTTSEVIAYHLLNIFTANLIIMDFTLIKVDFSETPSSVASVSRERIL